MKMDDCSRGEEEEEKQEVEEEAATETRRNQGPGWRVEGDDMEEAGKPGWGDTMRKKKGGGRKTRSFSQPERKLAASIQAVFSKLLSGFSGDGHVLARVQGGCENKKPQCCGGDEK